MTKAEIRDITASCLDNKRLCRILLRYDTNYRYYVPLIMSEKLLLGAEEDDFIINGYTIRRFKDITKADIKNDMCGEILRREGIIDRIVIPDINLVNWEAALYSLQARNENIIVEKESLNENECQFVIGRIERVYKKYAYIRHFDADGIWQDEPFRIPYTEITSVTFASRYVATYSKYLDGLPENFGKSKQGILMP